MELFKSARRKSLISDLAHSVLNVFVAIATVVVIQFTESLFLAIFIVLLSKWRVFAVRPRFWFANVQSNLVDYIVNISIVILMYLAHTSNVINIEKNIVIGIYFLLYVAWLLYIKPKSKRSFMALQSGFALFLGVSALYSIGYDWWATPVVLLMWIIGYAFSRHILSSYDESRITFLSLIFGFGLAELGWIVYQWTVAYVPFGITALSFPRASLTLLCLSIIVYKSYDSYYHNEKIKWSQIKTPVAFAISIIILLPTILSLLGPNISIGL